jgi:hypothetical protein
MFPIKRESGTGSPNRRKSQFQVGDRAIAINSQSGTVIRVDRDESGDYIVLRLDILPGDFAYDPWELEKI